MMREQRSAGPCFPSDRLLSGRVGFAFFPDVLDRSLSGSLATLSLLRHKIVTTAAL